MAVDGEKAQEGEKRPDGERNNDGGKKAEGSKKTESTMSVEDKLVHLEKRLEELEGRLASPKRKPASRDEISDDESESIATVVKAEGSAGSEKMSSTIGRARIVTYSIEDGKRKYREPHSETDPRSKVTQNDCALELRKIFEPGYNYGEIEILDRDLRDLLRTCLAHYPGHSLVGETLVLRTPYAPLVFNWDKLIQEASRTLTDKSCERARSDLQNLLDTLVSGSGDERLDTYFRSRDELNRQQSIYFEAIWTIFPPGSVVYSNIFLKHDPSQGQIFIVADDNRLWPKKTDTRSRRAKTSYWRLKCWTYDFTGKDFARQSVTLAIEAFEGPKPITSLSCYPLDAMEEGKRRKVEAELRKRGELFRSYCTSDEDHRMYDYDGEAIFEKQGFRNGSVPYMQQSDSDGDDDYPIFRERYGLPPPTQTARPLTESTVMVDFGSYFRYGPSFSKIGEHTTSDDITDCRCPICSKNQTLREVFKPHYDISVDEPSKDWEELQLMLCPPRILGYVLKEKQWAQLAVNQLKDIKQVDYEEIMKDLHLSGKDSGKAKKDMVYGLVQHHGSTKLDDLVAEKGRGLVFLLYGAPGVGKTSTAQMIARAARKPLFSIGVADVGTKAKEVESNLGTIFNLATTWRAILLIDEADVFLQSRSQNKVTGPSADGSALVSVFLRVLEYYSGILFLTTNQIAQFDVAVQSRVHIALNYQKLNEEQTAKIFMGFVNQYKEQNAVDSRDYKKIKKYSESEDLFRKELDGRQIRNVISCAMGYAKGQSEDQMTLDHIKDVIGYVENFQKDLAGSMRDWRQSQKEASIS